MPHYGCWFSLAANGKAGYHAHVRLKKVALEANQEWSCFPGAGCREGRL